MDNRKQMFQTVCSECGDDCEVPFKPTGGKPVLCSTCFGQQRGDSHRGKSGDRRGRPRDFRGRSNDRNGRSGDRQMFPAVCDKCGDKCEVPFRPSGGKPVLCSTCFGKDSGGRDRRSGGDRHRDAGNNQVIQKINSLGTKLDKILNLLDPGAAPKESVAKEATTKYAPKKPTAKKKSASKSGKKPAKKAGKKKK